MALDLVGQLLGSFSWREKASLALENIFGDAFDLINQWRNNNFSLLERIALVEESEARDAAYDSEKNRIILTKKLLDKSVEIV